MILTSNCPSRPLRGGNKRGEIKPVVTLAIWTWYEFSFPTSYIFLVRKVTDVTNISKWDTGHCFPDDNDICGIISKATHPILVRCDHLRPFSEWFQEIVWVIKGPSILMESAGHSGEGAAIWGETLQFWGNISWNQGKFITMRTMAVNLSVERNQIQLVHSSRSSWKQSRVTVQANREALCSCSEWWP